MIMIDAAAADDKIIILIIMIIIFLHRHWDILAHILFGRGSGGRNSNNLYRTVFSFKNQNSKKNFRHLHGDLNLDEIKNALRLLSVNGETI